ncbi:hypothetical protein PV350_34235 [Streptomyces sp. PA03-6a]|nr:hypothetical protein [Streptomyces sp. PA03-6a]
MSDENQPQQLRRAGIAAFAATSVVTLASFALFPGLPHVIDWGAVLVALVLGAVARHGVRSWLRRRSGKEHGGQRSRPSGL